MARGETAPLPAQPVQITKGGKTYNGSYTTAKGMITVSYLGRTKTTQLGGSAAAPENLARIMLRELVDAAERRG